GRTAVGAVHHASAANRARHPVQGSASCHSLHHRPNLLMQKPLFPKTAELPYTLVKSGFSPKSIVEVVMKLRSSFASAMAVACLAAAAFAQTAPPAQTAALPPLPGPPTVTTPSKVAIIN